MIAKEMAGAAAALLLEPDRLDCDASIDALAHVIDGEAGDCHGGKRLHFHTGPAEDPDGRFDLKEDIAWRREVDLDPRQGKGMA